MRNLDSIRVLVITGGLQKLSKTVAPLLEAHARGATFALVVRAYDAPIGVQYTFVRELRRALPIEIPVIFAGHPEGAREASADGVHLGRRVATVADARRYFPPGTWVSVPVHTADDIADAEREGAYAALVSPVESAPGKGQPIGFTGLSAMLAGASAGPLRAFALGGMGPGSGEPSLRAGAHGIAVIRSVWSARNPADSLHSLWTEVEAAASTGAAP